MFLRPGKADVQKMYLQVITSAFGHNNIFAFISWKGWKEELIMYSSEVIEEVISRNDIVDVISGYIKLKKMEVHMLGFVHSIMRSRHHFLCLARSRCITVLAVELEEM